MTSDPFGLSVQILTMATGVHPDTARRWKRRGRIPKHYQALITLHITGDLGAIERAWSGFRIAGGKIWTPENTSVTPGDVRAIPYRIQLVSELQRQLAQPQQWKLF